jgi:hypothetical protein
MIPTLDICFTYWAFLEWLGKNVVIKKIGMLAILTHFKETFRVNVNSLTLIDMKVLKNQNLSIFLATY